MSCWYKIRFNKNRKNVWKDGELNPTLLGERQLCLPHYHEITNVNMQNLWMCFLLENFGIFPHFQGFSGIFTGQKRGHTTELYFRDCVHLTPFYDNFH